MRSSALVQQIARDVRAQFPQVKTLRMNKHSLRFTLEGRPYKILTAGDELPTYVYTEGLLQPVGQAMLPHLALQAIHWDKSARNEMAHAQPHGKLSTLACLFSNGETMRTVYTSTLGLADLQKQYIILLRITEVLPEGDGDQVAALVAWLGDILGKSGWPSPSALETEPYPRESLHLPAATE